MVEKWNILKNQRLNMKIQAFFYVNNLIFLVDKQCNKVVNKWKRVKSEKIRI